MCYENSMKEWHADYELSVIGIFNMGENRTDYFRLQS